MKAVVVFTGDNSRVKVVGTSPEASARAKEKETQRVLYVVERFTMI